MTRHERDEYERRAVLNACVLAAVYPWKARQQPPITLEWKSGKDSPFKLVVAAAACACMDLYEYDDHALFVHVDQYLRHLCNMPGEFHHRCDDLGYELLMSSSPALELRGDYYYDWWYGIREERVSCELAKRRDDEVLKHIVSSFERVYVPMLAEPRRADTVLDRIHALLHGEKKRIAAE